MIDFYIVSTSFFLKRKGLSEERVVSITKKEYGFAMQFWRFIMSWKSISDELLSAICWRSLLFGIFMTKIVCWI